MTGPSTEPDSDVWETCPSCGGDLNKPASASCPQFAHQTVGGPPHKYPEYLPRKVGE